MPFKPLKRATQYTVDKGSKGLDKAISCYKWPRDFK